MKYLKVILFTVILSTICGGLLLWINYFTKERIERYEEFVKHSSALEVLGISYSRENIEDVFSNNIISKDLDGYIFYKARDGAIAFEIKGSGLWGPIRGFIALEPDYSTIRRLLITHQEETPGLGGRIEEKDFLSQFRGKRNFPKIVFVPEGKAKTGNEVDAITGATGSSRALEKLLNENIKKAVDIIKARGI